MATSPAELPHAAGSLNWAHLSPLRATSEANASNERQAVTRFLFETNDAVQACQLTPGWASDGSLLGHSSAVLPSLRRGGPWLPVASSGCPRFDRNTQGRKTRIQAGPNASRCRFLGRHRGCQRETQAADVANTVRPARSDPRTRVILVKNRRKPCGVPSHAVMLKSCGAKPHAAGLGRGLSLLTDQAATARAVCR